MGFPLLWESIKYELKKIGKKSNIYAESYLSTCVDVTIGHN